MKKFKVECPAKINLSLKIVNRRADGFHNLENLMQTINLFDYLTINLIKSEEFEIKLSGTSDEIPYDEKNIVFKTVLKFIELAQKVSYIEPHKIEIHIEKNIPVSAGLAGGSTDAAGAVLGLNEIFGEPLTREQLHEICAQLGSDLNFCLEGGRQMTTSRGEVLQKQPFVEFSLSLIKPKNLGISAKEAYTKFAKKMANGEGGREEFVNDLEWAVIEDYEVLQQIKMDYSNAIMSGSGSTFFMVDEEFTSQDDFWVCNNLKSILTGCRVVKF